MMCDLYKHPGRYQLCLVGDFETVYTDLTKIRRWEKVKCVQA